MIEHRNEKGNLHRVDGPAVVYADGTCEWWVDGKRHSKWGRALGVDGPAVAKELREKDAEIERLRSIIKRADAILAEKDDHWSERIEGARNALFEGLEEKR